MNQARVIIDSPYKNSDIIYATDFFCLDPIIYIEFNKQKIGWLPSTEIEKAKIKSKLTNVNNLTDQFKLINENKKYPPLKSSIIIDWLNEKKIEKILVPESFPFNEAINIQKAGIIVESQTGSFYQSRISKNEIEINYIKENSNKNIMVMDEVFNIIAESTINNEKKLKYKGEILTSEFLQNYILKSFIDKDLISDNVIVSIGDQGCFPHEYGSGELYANTSIIVDIYPRSRKNLYYTDMTRTFCKGKATEDLKNIYNTVLEAQKIGLESIKSNADGKMIHQKIQKYFDENNYKTGLINGILQGFFHGTGHGLGLDCHEPPYISVSGKILPDKSIVSVEPGLYYLDIGAVRIEDLVLITKNGPEILTEYKKILEVE